MAAEPEKCERKGTVVWADGCFDMTHYGHLNALRQAKSLGDYLIVGVHSDADILQHKGPTVMQEQERYLAVRACKWVDEVVEGAPYVTSLDVINQYGVDFVVHGDDLSVSAETGEDTYAAIKAAGKMRIVPRTTGVSTTDLVGRMLLHTRDHHQERPVLDAQFNSMIEGAQPKRSPYTRCTQFLATSRKIVQFSEGREPKPTDKVVYIDGGFDVFHAGHIAVLKEARKFGDYLIVGVHSDQEINRIHGDMWPVMNLQERVLGLLGCRYVDECVIGAPYSVTKEMIETLHIQVVLHGSQYAAHMDVDGLDPYRVPKELGLFQIVKSPVPLTTTDVVGRIVANATAFLERNRKKEKREVDKLEESGESNKKIKPNE